MESEPPPSSAVGSAASINPVQAWADEMTSAWERTKDHAHQYPYVWASYAVTVR